MKKAFTLVEMLIVVTILAVLMSITFKLVGLGEGDSARATTVVRMQKLENCLSGYYAAFGSYPPVKQHNSTDIFLKLEATGDQSQDGERDDSELNSDSVIAACRSQPVGCEFPGGTTFAQTIRSSMQTLAERANNASRYPAYANSSMAEVYKQNCTVADPNNSALIAERDSTEWSSIQLFKFGLLSYLLPRYLFMTEADGAFFGAKGRGQSAYAQWTSNNEVPSDPFEGRTFDGWNDVVGDENMSDNQQRLHNIKLANIPTQAVCARWMPNLEKTCNTMPMSKSFFGVCISQHGEGTVVWAMSDDTPPPLLGKMHYYPETKQAYVNDGITVCDGWSNEFFYYSPPPYQSYTLWSSGADGKTFPPWVSIDSLKNAKMKETAVEWKKDDVIQMSN